MSAVVPVTLTRSDPAEDAFTIPSTVSDALLQLQGVGSLATATDWARAAFVSALVTEGRPRADTVRSDRYLTPQEFAAVGIKGLKSKNSVRRYLIAWERFAGRPKPRLGDRIEVPVQPFPTIAELNAWIMRMNTATVADDAPQSPPRKRRTVDPAVKAERVIRQALPLIPTEVALALITEKVRTDPRGVEHVDVLGAVDLMIANTYGSLEEFALRFGLDVVVLDDDEVDA